MLFASGRIVINWSIILWNWFAAPSFAVISGDFCDYENFKVTCGPEEIIVIGSATYGHMALGRCVEFDTGQLGCQSDVYDIIHERCSGKQTCEMSADDPALRASSSCRRGVTLYLDASYACLKGMEMGITYWCKCGDFLLYVRHQLRNCMLK